MSLNSSCTIYYLSDGVYDDWNVEKLNRECKIAYGPEFKPEDNMQLIRKIYIMGLQELHILSKNKISLSYIHVDPESFAEKIIKNSESNLELDTLVKECESVCGPTDLSKVLDHQSIKDVNKLESATRREEYKKLMNNNKTEKRTNVPSTKKILDFAKESKSKSKRKSKSNNNDSIKIKTEEKVKPKLKIKKLNTSMGQAS